MIAPVKIYGLPSCPVTDLRMIIPLIRIGHWAKTRGALVKVVGFSSKHLPHQVIVTSLKSDNTYHVGLQEIQQIWQEKPDDYR